MKPPRMKPADRDEACRLVVLALLKNLLIATRNKGDPVTWRRLGGPEAVDFLRALETGRWHPVLTKWEELKATAASAPSLLDQTIRHTAILLVEALQRAGLGPGAARQRAAEAVQPVRPSTTRRTIKYWQGNHSISAEDKRLIAQAIEYHGHDHDRLVGHFAALIDWGDSPVAAWTAVRRLPPGGQ